MWSFIDPGLLDNVFPKDSAIEQVRVIVLGLTL
jgi:hypothetical protein